MLLRYGKPTIPTTNAHESTSIVNRRKFKYSVVSPTHHYSYHEKYAATRINENNINYNDDSKVIQFHSRLFSLPSFLFLLRIDY